ncbi:MAG TPA: DVUA0089 family protein, partial [Candidatus Binataceae bacterium]|nr:DVUA0089 family protein [Candidatus Binataceae bacterium]
NNDIAHAQAIDFPVLMNGTIRAGDYDYFKFSARPGETLVFDVSAGRNQSGLDSVLSLLDERGTELAYIDDYYWFKDPHLAYTFRSAGTYYLRIYGTGESGSENADYRLIAGEMPHVYHAMPSGGQRGSTVDVQLDGVNLDTVGDGILGEGLATAKLISHGKDSAMLRMLIPPDTPPGIYRLHVHGASLPVAFAVSDLPEVTVTGGAARHKKDAFPLSLPMVANGTIETSHAIDYFSFKVGQPENVLLAVDSFHLGSKMDPIVIVYDQSGKRIAYQDDPTTNSGKEPANVDPHLVVHLQPGRYTAAVRDNSFLGDPNFPYRLTVKKAEPDFTAALIGTDETLFRGRNNVVQVQVRRLEGWNTPIEVWAENLPAGVTGPGKILVPVEPTHYKGTCGEDLILDGTRIDYPLQVTADAPVGLNLVRFHARGVIDGKTVDHAIVPNYWWSSSRKIWGPAESSDWYATVADRPLVVLGVPDRVNAPKGKPGAIPVVVTRLDDGQAPLELRAPQPPAGVTVEPATVLPGGTLASVKISAAIDKPVSIVLEAVTAGKVIGQTHRILIDPAARSGRTEAPRDAN